jgi:hypothetical protein
MKDKPNSSGMYMENYYQNTGKAGKIDFSQ